MSLHWPRMDLDFEHAGGGAFVLNSVLDADGTAWDEAPDQSLCKITWHKGYKKAFTKAGLITAA